MKNIDVGVQARYSDERWCDSGGSLIVRDQDDYASREKVERKAD